MPSSTGESGNVGETGGLDELHGDLGEAGFTNDSTHALTSCASVLNRRMTRIIQNQQRIV